MSEAALRSSESKSTTASIVATPGVCGGDARIADTRIPVWVIDSLRRQGAAENDILEAYPWLTVEQIRAAWDYADRHHDEIESAIQENEDASA